MTSLLKRLFLVIFYMASRLTYYVYLLKYIFVFLKLYSAGSKLYITKKDPGLPGLCNYYQDCYVNLILTAPLL